MTENRAVLAAALNAHQAGRPAVMVTVIQTEGSVPRAPGCKMLVWPDSGIVGTIGGGQLEAVVVQAALAALADEQAQLMSYNLAELGGIVPVKTRESSLSSSTL